LPSETEPIRSALVKAHLLIPLLLLLGCALHGADPDPLAVFDAESQAYLHSSRHTERLFAPFYTDLQRFARDTSGSDFDHFRALCAVISRTLIQPQFLPASYASAEPPSRSNRMAARDFPGAFLSFDDIPRELLPSYSRHDAPASFSVWRYEKEGTVFLMLNGSASFHVMVVHRDAGFGLEDAPDEQALQQLRDRYFRFPPGIVKLPAGWSSTLQILERRGKFVRGHMLSQVDGQPLNGVTSWEGKSDFFFDGHNLAFSVTQWDFNGRPVTHPN
jgi:hypothetical protein